MDAIEKLLNFAEKSWGVPGRRVAVASLPVIALLSYYGIFEALYHLDLFGPLWAHAIALCLIAGTAWTLFAPRVLAAIDGGHSAFVCSLVVVGLAFGVAAVTQLSRALLDRLAIATMLTLVVLFLSGPLPTSSTGITPRGRAPERVPNATPIRRLADMIWRWASWLRVGAGIAVVALLTLSLPEAVAWITTPRPTAHDKVGVWVAKFEGDEANETQRSLMTAIEAVAFEDRALSGLVEINALPRVIALEGPRAQQFKAAEEVRSAVNASLLIFGTYSKAQANVYTAVPPEYLAFVPFFLIPTFPELRIDCSDQLGAVYVVAKYITGTIYFGKGDCGNARRQLQAALDRTEQNKSLTDVVRSDDIRVAVAHSVNCNASRGQADAEQLHQSIANVEQIAGRLATPPDDELSNDDLTRRATVAASAWAAQGMAYRLLSRFRGEPAADDLGHAILAYKQALTARSQIPDGHAPSLAPFLEMSIHSNLGVAYEKLSERSEQSDRVANLMRAVEEYALANAVPLCKYTASGSQVAAGCATTENNRGMTLLRLAEAGVEPIANFKQAIDAFIHATAQLSTTAEGERSRYALFRSNLADSYRVLAGYEDHDANLRQAHRAIEDSLTVGRTAKDPDTFAEVMYKYGQIEAAEAAQTHNDASEQAALAYWACSLVVFDGNHDQRAAVVAHDLNKVRKRVGDAAFEQKLGAQRATSECTYAPGEVIRLIAAYEN
jgi:tetratricopeptide (TPR) repeat protein